MPPSLTGDFAVMPMPDLILYLGNRRLTGKLEVNSQRRAKTAVVYEGQVVTASSNDPREYLSQFLVNFGHIGEDQLNRAMRANPEKTPLGQLLVRTGAITSEVMRTVLMLKARETILDAFRWTAGTFTFELVPPPATMDGIEAPVALLDIHREGEFRETAWAAIRQAFPDGTATLKLDDSRISKDPASQGTMDQKLFEAAREGQSIEEMVFSLHTTDFHLYQRLYALYRQGAVAPGRLKTVSEPSQGAVLGEETPVEGLLTHAKEFMSTGRYAEAEVLCQRILEISPSPATSELLREAEAGLFEALRTQLMAPPCVPELAVEAARIRAPDLSPPEKYLLSRIDGHRDIRSIINVAPLRELDALKYFQHFVENGLIRLKA